MFVVMWESKFQFIIGAFCLMAEEQMPIMKNAWADFQGCDRTKANVGLQKYFVGVRSAGWQKNTILVTLKNTITETCNQRR